MSQISYLEYVAQCVQDFMTLEYVRRDGPPLHMLDDGILWGFWIAAPCQVSFETFCADMRETLESELH